MTPLTPTPEPPAAARPPLPAGRVAALVGSLRGSGTGLAVLALAVGAIGGLGAVVFRELIRACTWVFTGQTDYGLGGREPSGLLPGLGPWFLLLAPVVGGLLYGPLVSRFAREARGHGVPEVMLAVSRGGSRIRPRVALVKALASGLCIGSGGSVGREGPIVQIGSAMASALGQAARLGEERLRLLVACGAAAGISATFNAPIAGVFFALEVILRDFAAEAFGAVVLSSFTADVIGRAAFGNAPFLALPVFRVGSPVEYALYAGLGVAGALVGLAFVRGLYGLEDVADRAWRGPEWLRPVVGGVLLGALLVAVPQLYGVGYPVLEHAVRGGYATWFLIALLVAKLAGTSLTMAIGGSGGVFAPSLFMGAMLGGAYGAAAHALLPSVAAAAGSYGLVGMAAVFAAAARAPITAIIVVFALTGDYAIILPLMLAVIVATGLSRLVSRDTIYTLKLRRRGIDLDAPAGRAPGHVADIMGPVPEPVPESLPLSSLAARLVREPSGAVPVAGADGRYHGLVGLGRTLESSRGRGEARARDLMHPVATLRPADDLGHAARLMMGGEGPVLPVLDGQPPQVVGWVTHGRLLAALGGNDIGGAGPSGNRTVSSHRISAQQEIPHGVEVRRP
jgi:chloride channel protein, CIC family